MDLAKSIPNPKEIRPLASAGKHAEFFDQFVFTIKTDQRVIRAPKWYQQKRQLVLPKTSPHTALSIEKIKKL